MNWLGLKRRTDSTQIADGESPDCSNCYWAEGVVGEIGPRKGKTVVDTQSYTIDGVGLLRLPNATNRWAIGLNGQQADQAAIKSSAVSDAMTAALRRLTFGSLSLSASLGSSDTQRGTLSSTLAAGSYELFIPTGFTITCSASGGGTALADVALTVKLVDGSNNSVSSNPTVFKMEDWATSLVWATTAGCWERAPITVTGTASKIEFTLAVAANTATAITATATGFTNILIRGG